MTLDTISSQATMLEREYERLLHWQDLVIRVLRNPKISPVYRDLYIALFDTYPDILAGQAVTIEPWRLRENAGWASESSATNFFKDLQSIGAFEYQAGSYNGKTAKRPSHLTPNPDVFPYPESFNTKDSEKRRKAREAEEKKRKQFQDPRKQFTCEVCGSYDLEYEATAICKSCQHRHRTIEHIPAADITIEAELIELADDWSWLDEPTEQRAAVKPGVAVVQASLSAAPVQEPPDPERRCIKCGRTRRECWYPSVSEPGMWSLHCLD